MQKLDNYKKLICLALILTFIYVFCSPCFAEESIYVWSDSSEILDVNASLTLLKMIIC